MAAIPADELARRGLKTVFHRHDLITERLIERYAAGYRSKGAARALANTIRQILPHQAAKLTARYCALSIPALIICGEHDHIVKSWQGEQLARELKNSRFVMIPGCGHNPHEECPIKTFDIIMDFLASCGVKNTDPFGS